MAEMSMNQIIHAAVLRDVARTERALRALRDGDQERARAIQRGWAQLHDKLSEHHQQEDALVWPYLRSEGVDAVLLGDMESEHQDLAEALRAGDEALRTVVAEPTAARAGTAADVIAKSARVIADHLEHEERDVEPLIQQRKEDPGWKAVEKKFREGGPSRAGNMMAWLQDGADDQARSALRDTIPVPVLAVLTGVFGRRYRTEIAPIWRS